LRFQETAAAYGRVAVSPFCSADSSGTLIAENSRVRMLNAAEASSALKLERCQGFAGDGGPANRAPRRGTIAVNAAEICSLPISTRSAGELDGHHQHCCR
jgi:hypothetical protein